MKAMKKNLFGKDKIEKQSTTEPTEKNRKMNNDNLSVRPELVEG
jgi:hypothetical protein